MPWALWAAVVAEVGQQVFHSAFLLHQSLPGRPVEEAAVVAEVEVEPSFQQAVQEEEVVESVLNSFGLTTVMW